MRPFPARQWLFSNLSEAERRSQGRGLAPATQRSREACASRYRPFAASEDLNGGYCPCRPRLPAASSRINPEAAASRFLDFQRVAGASAALEAPPRRLDLCKESEPSLQEPVSIFSKLASGLRTEAATRADERPYREAVRVRQGRCSGMFENPCRTPLRAAAGGRYLGPRSNGSRAPPVRITPLVYRPASRLPLPLSC